jgi:hypothetical protein
MIRGTRASFCLALFLLLAPAAAAQQAESPSIDATALLKRAFLNLYGEDYVQNITLSTRAHGGSSMTRSLQITRKQSTDPGKALLRFTDPPEVRRTSILILENRNSSDDLYVYLPALRRTKHLTSSQRADAFFGTDFSYEDVEPKRAEDYRASWVGAGVHEGQACALVEIVALPEIETVYEKMVSCIEAERAIILWTDFYERGRVAKRLEIELADVRSVADRFIPFSMTMRTPRARSETRSVTTRYELRADIPDELFSTWNLEAGDARRDRSRSASAADGESVAVAIEPSASVAEAGDPF